MLNDLKSSAHVLRTFHSKESLQFIQTSIHDQKKTLSLADNWGNVFKAFARILKQSIYFTSF